MNSVLWGMACLQIVGVATTADPPVQTNWGAVMSMISSLAYRRQPQADVKHDDLDYGYAERESTHWPSSDLTHRWLGNRLAAQFLGYRLWLYCEHDAGRWQRNL